MEGEKVRLLGTVRLLALVYLLHFACGLTSSAVAQAVTPQVQASTPLEIRFTPITEKIPQDINADELSRLPLANAQLPYRLTSARNGFASLNIVLKPLGALLADKISVRLSGFSSSSGEAIRNTSGQDQNIFDFRKRPIELFFVRYLEIKGLSKISYETYDERHIPKAFRRAYTGEGEGRGGWKERPHANKKYPDILVPLELVKEFAIQPPLTQSVVADIFVDKGTAPGLYKGKIEILQLNRTVQTFPVELEVLVPELADASPASALSYLEVADIAERYLGNRYPESAGQQKQLNEIVDNHFRLMKRHGVALFDKNEGAGSGNERKPRPEWLPRLSGATFSAEEGYAGPGEDKGQKLFVVGAYGNWPGKDNKEEMSAYLRSWDEWRKANAKDKDFIFYLADESSEYEKLQSWTAIAKQAAPGLKVFATVPLPAALAHLPGLDIAGSWFNFGITSVWEQSLAQWSKRGKELYLYNGKRPLTGSFATEDEGTSLRLLAWSQIKMGIPLWFFWNATYYTDYQGGNGATDLFKSAHTFGGKDKQDTIIGETGWNYSNGDGVLVYPGTDKKFPKDSYSVPGPFASLRLKEWRTGIEDAKYIELAFAADALKTRAIMQRMAPKVLWQVGVADEKDPSWKKTDVSWPTDSQSWERAREDLVQIIKSH